MNNRIAIFASGEGSNAINLIHKSNNYPLLKISCVITDNPDAKIIQKMKDNFPEIPVFVIPINKRLKGNIRRKNHEEAIVNLLDEMQINWIILAGYMRLLGPTLLKYFNSTNGEKTIFNIHPSLLPKYPGLNSYAKAFQNKDEFSGVTVHFVDEGMDTGEIIIQKRFKISGFNLLEEVVNAGKKIEWETFPEVFKIIQNKITNLKGNSDESSRIKSYNS